MSEGIDRYADILAGAAASSAFSEVARIIRKQLEKNPNATKEELLRVIGESVEIREAVNAVLNPDDQTRTRRKEIG